MIFDSITNLNNYFQSDFCNLIYNEVNSISSNSEDGVISIENDNYIKVMTLFTQRNPLVIESHKEEVDIQLLLDGNEKIQLYDKEDVKISDDYNPETDCVFYSICGEPISEIVLKKGKFAVFFPDDIHRPLVAIDVPQKLKKIVFKLNLNWMNKINSSSQ